MDAAEQGDHDMSQLRQEANDVVAELEQQLEEAEQHGDQGAIERIQALIDQAQQAWQTATDHLGDGDDPEGSFGTPPTSGGEQAPAAPTTPDDPTAQNPDRSDDEHPGSASVADEPTSEPTEPSAERTPPTEPTGESDASPDGESGSEPDETPLPTAPADSDDDAPRAPRKRPSPRAT